MRSPPVEGIDPRRPAPARDGGNSGDARCGPDARPPASFCEPPHDPRPGSFVASGTSGAGGRPAGSASARACAQCAHAFAHLHPGGTMGGCDRFQPQGGRGRWEIPGGLRSGARFPAGVRRAQRAHAGLRRDDDRPERARHFAHPRDGRRTFAGVPAGFRQRRGGVPRDAARGAGPLRPLGRGSRRAGASCDPAVHPCVPTRGAGRRLGSQGRHGLRAQGAGAVP